MKNIFVLSMALIMNLQLMAQLRSVSGTVIDCKDRSAMIDGVIVQGGAGSRISFGLGDALRNSPISTISTLLTINPSNLLSMEILKDAIIFRAPMQHHQLSSPGGTDIVRYFVSGSFMKQDGTVFINYTSSDTRMHVAISNVGRLMDYCLHTPEDGLTTAAYVCTLKKHIEKNLRYSTQLINVGSEITRKMKNR